MNPRKAFLVLALVALIGGISGYAVYRVGRATKNPASATVHGGGPIVRLVKNPEPAPSFEMKDLSGQTVSPGEWHGKVVLLNFWATWCPPCRQEIPELISLQEKYHDHLQIIGVSEDDDPPAKVLHFAQQKGINYPIVMATPELEKAYGGVPALPTTFVVDERGRVVQRHTGLYPVDDYNRELAVLMDLPTDAKVETFEDTGQVFLQNVDKATSIPGVDFTGLTDAQRKHALRRMNAEGCTCGCKLTVAECRVTDSECPVSLKQAAQIVDEVRRGVPDPPSDNAPNDSAAPSEKSEGPAAPAKAAPNAPPAKAAAVITSPAPRG